MANCTAITSTFYITSTRIDIFKLILTSHPSSHSTPFLRQGTVLYSTKFLQTNMYKKKKKKRNSPYPLLYNIPLKGLVFLYNKALSSVLRWLSDRWEFTFYHEAGSRRVCARIFLLLYVPRPEFFKRNSCEALTLVTIRFLRGVVHLDSADEKKRPDEICMRCKSTYLSGSKAYRAAHCVPSSFQIFILSLFFQITAIGYGCPVLKYLHNVLHLRIDFWSKFWI